MKKYSAILLSCLVLALIGFCISTFFHQSVPAAKPDGSITDPGFDDISAADDADNIDSISIDNISIDNIDDTNTSRNNADSFAIHELDINTAENRENELVFTVSIDDFIQSYNGYYWSSYGVRGLAPASEWNHTRCDHAIHSPHDTERCRFSSDDGVWTLPIITVDTPTDADYIQEIFINYDDHSYTESSYTQYETMCHYTLKVFFPDFNDDKLTALYRTLNRLAYANIYNSDMQYGAFADPVPCALYYQDGIGLYPYFTLGRAYLCIIPVTDSLINEFASKGADIHRISDEFP